ncbi:MAG: right-handed parallel beta-helix repeat-containing protein [Methylovulum sp.]|nr:right-handed parallel beta-helix repeat-containing protein [Methylovulum sp.]
MPDFTNQPTNLALKSLAVAITLAFGMASAHATTFTVDGTNCTLPDAVKAASTNTAVGGCPAGGATDTLNLTAKDYILTTAATGNNGLWPISGIVTINGKPGVGSVISRSKAVTEPFRLFQVNNDGALTLSRVSVQNGKTDYANGGNGGGILNSGQLTLTDTTVSGNSTYYSGGGIFSDGTLTLTNSTVSGNSAEYEFDGGGGIFSGGTLTLTNSTISGNSAAGYLGGGGGILSRGTLTLTNSTVSGNSSSRSYGGGITAYGPSTLTNSTVSGNSSRSYGGGIYSRGIITLTSSTVSGNSAGDYGGGIIAQHLTLTNSLIANSPSGGDCAITAFSGTLPIYKGKNLIEDGSCAVVANGGLQGDPRLAPLLDNGGPTRTHALLTRSSAINAADDTVLPKQLKDQRGAKRPQGTHSDIGAFELISSAEATLQPIITFFDQKTASGELLGTGASPATQLQRLVVTRGQLLLASDFIRQANTAKACKQLKNTLRHIDTDLTPDARDYVTGTAGGDLATMLKTVRTDLSCP